MQKPTKVALFNVIINKLLNNENYYCKSRNCL